MNFMVFAIDFTIKPQGKWGVIAEKFAGGEELRQRVRWTASFRGFPSFCCLNYSFCTGFPMLSASFC
ncbi:unnamed protein product [Calypogeia fissa]